MLYLVWLPVLKRTTLILPLICFRPARGGAGKSFNYYKKDSARTIVITILLLFGWRFLTSMFGLISQEVIVWLEAVTFGIFGFLFLFIYFINPSLSTLVFCGLLL